MTSSPSAAVMDDPNHEECGDESQLSSPLSMLSPVAPRYYIEHVWSDINDLSILDQPNPNNNAFSMSDTTIVLDRFMPAGSSPTSDNSTTTTFTPPSVTPSMTLNTTGSDDGHAATDAFPDPVNNNNNNKAVEEAEDNRRHKNMESTARSTAGEDEDVYITELEAEFLRVHEDNARIKREFAKQLEEIVAEERYHIQKKKRGLYRTFSSSF